MKKINCPYCGSENVIKKAIRNQKQRYLCKDCLADKRRARFTIDLLTGKAIEKKAKIDQQEKKENKLIRLLETRQLSVEELSNQSGLLPADVRFKINYLKEQKYNINVFEGKYELSNSMKQGNIQKLNIEYWKGDKIKVGFIADTHLCSNYERLDALNLLYDVFADEGIEVVYHGGNYIDGECRFNKYEIHTRGVTPQVEYFINTYPQKVGILTKFIVGDDHEGWYIHNNKINIGEYTQMKAEKIGRNDLEYIGYVECDIPLEGVEGKSWLRVMHGGGGTAYALSYTPQKIVESFEGGEKPRVLLLGHYHKLDYCFPREVHVIQMGCCEDQTIFMRKKKIQAHVGGGILHMRLAKDGTVNRIMPEFITIFNKKFYIGNDKYWR